MISYVDICSCGRYGIFLKDIDYYAPDGPVIITNARVKYNGHDEGSSNDDGIHLDNADDTFIEYVISSRNDGYGIYNDESDDITVFHCNFRHNSDDSGEDDDAWENEDDGTWTRNYYEDDDQEGSYEVNGPGTAEDDAPRGEPWDDITWDP